MFLITCFLNFWWEGGSNLFRVKTKAQSLGRNEYDIYAGIDCAIEGYETEVNWERIFPEGAEHNTSLGLYQPNDFLWGKASGLEDDLNREKRFWSGANGDPSNTETAHHWKGFAHYVPAFSVIDDLPFFTNFCTGAGNDYYVNGNKMSHISRSESGWNNIALQDILPTWRWIVESSGEKLNVDFDFTDAYYGGSSLKIYGNLSSDNHIKLYKTKLEINSTTKIDIAFKTGKTAPTNMKVGISFEEDPSSFNYLDIGNTTSNNWDKKTLELGSFAGKTIAVISLFFEGGAGNDYQINIGRIGVYNGQTVTPSAPSALQIIKKTNEIDFVTLRLKWEPSPSKIALYNVYRVNPDQSRTYLAGTTNNYCFVPWIGQEPGDTNVVVEVEAVGLEFGVSEKISTSFIWYSQPLKASSPNPANNSGDIYRNTKLIWITGSGAASHEVYLGTSVTPGFIGTTADNEFDPGILEPNTTYYWRVNGKNPLYETEGDLWTFTTGSAILDTSNNALQFDGINDYVNCGNTPSLQITGKEITIEAWINPSSFKPKSTRAA